MIGAPPPHPKPIAAGRSALRVARRQATTGHSPDRLPNVQLRIYPDANHGFLEQYPELFGDHVRTFLNAL
jgi:pimeloyl-ACP methyl ester carboxylesterase